MLFKARFKQHILNTLIAEVYLSEKIWFVLLRQQNLQKSLSVMILTGLFKLNVQPETKSAITRAFSPKSVWALIQKFAGLAQRKEVADKQWEIKIMVNSPPSICRSVGAEVK